MSKITFKPAADVSGVSTSEPVKSRQGNRLRATVYGQTGLLAAEGKTPDLVVSGTPSPGIDVAAFTVSGIWDGAEDVSGRAWDEINQVLTDDGGGGARRTASSDEAEIVTTTRAPALVCPRI